MLFFKVTESGTGKRRLIPANTIQVMEAMNPNDGYGTIFVLNPMQVVDKNGQPSVIQLTITADGGFTGYCEGLKEARCLAEPIDVDKSLEIVKKPS